MTHQTPDAPLSQLRFLMEAVQAAESRAREAEQRLVVLEQALKVAIRWIIEDGPQAGWDVDRLRAALSPKEPQP